MIKQVLETPFVHRGKLVEFLTKRFGEGNYEVHVSL
jgi:hypothetical protein